MCKNIESFRLKVYIYAITRTLTQAKKKKKMVAVLPHFSPLIEAVNKFSGRGIGDDGGKGR